MRLLFTKKEIFFCQQTENQVVDKIPLDEVESIKTQGGLIEERLNSWIPRDSQDNETVGEIPGSENVMRIETIPDGYNSARNYHVQVNNFIHHLTHGTISIFICRQVHSADLDGMIKTLRSLAKQAKAKLLNKNRLETIQSHIRTAFESDSCQNILAVLIFAVNKALHGRESKRYILSLKHGRRHLTR